MIEESSTSTSSDQEEADYFLMDDEKELVPCDVCKKILPWGRLIMGACEDCFDVMVIDNRAPPKGSSILDGLIGMQMEIVVQINKKVKSGLPAKRDK